MKKRARDSIVLRERAPAAHTRCTSAAYRHTGCAAAVVLASLGGLSACGSRLDQGLHSTDTGNPPFVDSARVTARLDGAKVLVVGAPGAVPANATVRVENRITDVVASVAAGSDGSFEMTIAGEAGDELDVFVAGRGETVSTTVEVPEPNGSLPQQPAVPPTAIAPGRADAGAALAGDESAATDAGRRSLEPRDVDWLNVNWSLSIDVEPSESPRVHPGLWMGTAIDGGEFAVEPAVSPPYALSSEPTSQRFTGTAPVPGGDTYFHVAFPVERQFQGVYFWARSRLPGGQDLRVTLGGAQEAYWSEVNTGGTWPVWEVALGETWSKHELSFSELGFDRENLAPYSDPWGALHFLTAAERVYDFEIYDLLLVNFLPE